MEGSWRGGKSEDAGGISILQRRKQAQGEGESDLLHLTPLMGGVWGQGVCGLPIQCSSFPGPTTASQLSADRCI